MNRTPFAETERAAPRSRAPGARAAGTGPLASTPARPRRAPLLIAAAFVALGLALRPTQAAAPSGLAGNPLLALTRSAADREPLVGRVVERLVAGSYAYVAIERDDGRRTWAVTLGRGAPEGARAHVRSFGRSSNFFSSRLQRTFPELIFGTLTRLD